MDRVTKAAPPKVTPRLSSCLTLSVLLLLCRFTQAGEQAEDPRAGKIRLKAVSGASSTCPSDVTMAAHACFTEFSREYQNVRHSPKLLCCGVDVETLRAFCSSYMRATRCIEDLLTQCEDPTAISTALTNLHGARPALHALCFDDTLIERYAPHQSCITHAGPTTLQCIRRYLNTSDNLRLLANVHTTKTTEFCRAMSDTLECIQRNVRQQCGERASQLVAILVGPMIRYSTTCTIASTPPPLNTTTQDQPATQQTMPSPSSHGSRPGSRSLHNTTSASACPVRYPMSLVLGCWILVLSILLACS